MNPIPDYLKKGLNILFVGFNPSVRSAETGHHYANPNNRFWTILHKAGLTPRKFAPEEDGKLLDLGFGLTNIVARPTLAAADITKEEYKEGKEILRDTVQYYRPKIVCFVGKGVYEQYSGKRKLSWGVQEEQVVEGVLEFVAPSSSGLVRMKLDDIVFIYSELNQLLMKLKQT
ncbi:G/U mismatch-specific DNA glycosylase [Bacillus fonticola]|uniref:G/U mismatch-specific DNA glycosylase n=1 Tax=Bacillus fonticola TaxID=2728853 RepID=UPI00147488D7|nr:G/U mismatch-specific DNA glycosylase [Bacillus fonticola]